MARVLLSAFACEPGAGSEPGIGWGWARGLAALGHEVTVLTRPCHRPRIEEWLRLRAADARSMAFLYYDLPGFEHSWYRGNLGVQAYYVPWQWGASSLALAEHRRRPF
ncbi:MAG: glycosyltransferase family 1 protein, partial [Candidatus Riflebacteria bacterium]|nr:glycosyltransferase family 1 protein [Candidatus Riflebacteria bacterium]